MLTVVHSRSIQYPELIEVECTCVGSELTTTATATWKIRQPKHFPVHGNSMFSNTQAPYVPVINYWDITINNMLSRMQFQNNEQRPRSSILSVYLYLDNTAKVHCYVVSAVGSCQGSNIHTHCAYNPVAEYLSERGKSSVCTHCRITPELRHGADTLVSGNCHNNDIGGN